MDNDKFLLKADLRNVRLKVFTLVQVWRVALYRLLAPMGLLFVLFVPVPFSLETLSVLEPVFLFCLLATWTISYLLKVTLTTRAGFQAAIPTLRRRLPGHLITADILKVSILGVGLVFVWLAWSSQPYRIFNMTLLGSAWGGVEIINTLLRFRGMDEDYSSHLESQRNRSRVLRVTCQSTRVNISHDSRALGTCRLVPRLNGPARSHQGKM